MEGCQKGVGVGVEMRAMDAVEPPLKGFVCCEEKGGWDGECKSSFALSGRSAATGSLSSLDNRNWARRKERSVCRKAWVRMVAIVGLVSREKAGGLKRRK